MSQPTANKLVREIIQHVKAKGGSQKALAAQAGVAAETLSKMKQKDDAMLSSINKLAAAAGLRLTLVPDDDLAERIIKGDIL